MLGTTLPGFRGCNALWLRLSKRPWTISHLGDKAYLPGRGTAFAPFHFTLVGPECRTG